MDGGAVEMWNWRLGCFSSFGQEQSWGGKAAEEWGGQTCALLPVCRALGSASSNSLLVSVRFPQHPGSLLPFA